MPRDVATLDVGDANRELGQALPQHPLIVRAVRPCFGGPDQRSSQRPRRSAKLTVPFECWDTDGPSECGYDGIERIRLVGDDIADRVADLYVRMQNWPPSHPARLSTQEEAKRLAVDARERDGVDL
jgi:hypothetical protein